MRDDYLLYDLQEVQRNDLIKNHFDDLQNAVIELVCERQYPIIPTQNKAYISEFVKNMKIQCKQIIDDRQTMEYVYEKHNSCILHKNDYQ